MGVVDTNVLVYAADEDAREHAQCRKMLEHWRSQATAWFLTWGIVYEFCRIVTHPRVFRRPWTVSDAWRFVDALLASPSLEILCETERHSDVAARVFRELPHVHGNLIHDAHTAVLMAEHGLKQIYTRDADFHRFPFLEVIDPLN